MKAISIPDIIRPNDIPPNPCERASNITTPIGPLQFIPKTRIAKTNTMADWQISTPNCKIIIIIIRKTNLSYHGFLSPELQPVPELFQMVLLLQPRTFAVTHPPFPEWSIETWIRKRALFRDNTILVTNFPILAIICCGLTLRRLRVERWLW